LVEVGGEANSVGLRNAVEDNVTGGQHCGGTEKWPVCRGSEGEGGKTQNRPTATTKRKAEGARGPAIRGHVL